MKTRYFLSWVIVTLLVIGSLSCGKTEYFKSESKVNEQLKGSWSLLPIPRTAANETWVFAEGTLYRHKASGFGMEPIPYDTATYSVNTSLLKVEVKIK